ncbi:MAG: hypothetical protein H6735_10390 [Alphaproteobacteria bacterium]|nr:hypothetical protein [Alphaproteobacteria bacterium]
MFPIALLPSLSAAEEPAPPPPERTYLREAPQAYSYMLHPRPDPLHVLPLGRDPGQWVVLAAGVQRCGSGFCIAGGATNENTWLLDGLNLTDPVTGGQRPERAGPAPRRPSEGRGIDPRPNAVVGLPPR